MSPAPKWPTRLYPPVRYTTCWRCGITVGTDYKPRACRDCHIIVRTERDLWNKEAA